MDKPEEYLKQLLENYTSIVYFDGHKKNLMLHCPNCEFNRKKETGHLGILLSDLRFNCFKCEFSGFITKLFDELEIPKKEYIDLIKNWNYENNTKLNYKSKKLKTGNVKKQTHYNKEKIDYLKNRLFIDKDNISKIPNLILDFKRFIKFNKNLKLNITDKKIEFLNKNYVGFLCNRNSQIIFRKIVNNEKYRKYEKVILTDEKLLFNDFYGFNNQKGSDIIVMGEGPFDILRSYNYKGLNDLKKDSLYWVASLGKKSMKNVVYSVLDYCCIPRINLVLLLDEDVDINSDLLFYINKMVEVKSLTLYYNKLDKDFGSEQIQPYKILYKTKKKY